MLFNILSVILLGFLQTENPKDESESYFPIKEGLIWTFSQSDPTKTEGTIEILKKVKRGEKYYFEFQHRGFGPDDLEFLSIDKDGIKGIKVWGVELNEPYTKVKFPLKNGDTWKEEREMVGGDNKMKITINGEVFEETITVAKKEYKCFKVKSKVTLMVIPIISEIWYAKDIGPVRMSINVAGQKMSADLKEFGKVTKKLVLNVGDRYTFVDKDKKETVFECVKSEKGSFEVKTSLDKMFKIDTKDGFRMDEDNIEIFIPSDYEEKKDWKYDKGDSKLACKVLGKEEVEIDKEKFACSKIELIVRKDAKEDRYEFLYEPTIGVVKSINGLTLKSIQRPHMIGSSGCRFMTKPFCKCKCEHCFNKGSVKCYCNSETPQCQCTVKTDKCKCTHCKKK